jgi:hypothetical protein
VGQPIPFLRHQQVWFVPGKGKISFFEEEFLEIKV